jgi:CheY-like chemotaxis protein
VLVVDDDAVYRSFTAMSLGELGVRVVGVASAREAMDAVKDNDVAVVLADVVMPGMDGFELVRHLLSDESTRDIPIVFISGDKVELEHVLRGYEIGAIDYLVKPVSPEILKRKVAYYLDQHRSRAELDELTRKHEQAMVQVRRLKADVRGTRQERPAGKAAAGKESAAAAASQAAASAARESAKDNIENCPVPMLNILQVESVRAQQRAEGNFDCFGRASGGYCDRTDCAYHTVCINISKNIPAE